MVHIWHLLGTLLCSWIWRLLFLCSDLLQKSGHLFSSTSHSLDFANSIKRDRVSQVPLSHLIAVLLFGKEVFKWSYSSPVALDWEAQIVWLCSGSWYWGWCTVWVGLPNLALQGPHSFLLNSCSSNRCWTDSWLYWRSENGIILSFFRINWVLY